MKDRKIVEWDKDDIEALKFMKVDILALGMLTCMAKSFVLIREHKNDDLPWIVAARMNKDFESVDDVWRRSNVLIEALVQVAEADASSRR